MQYYFDRTVPLFLTTEGSFDAVPVQVDEDLAGFIAELQCIVSTITDRMPEYGSPEDSAQQIADVFLSQVGRTSIFVGLESLIGSMSAELEEHDNDETED